MKNITDLSLSMIAKYCGQLTHLDIQDCTNITDYGVSIISQECKNLEDLNLNGCGNVSNSIVSYICHYNRSLKILDLRNTKINGDAIVYILGNLVELENLKISGLPLKKRKCQFNAPPQFKIPQIIRYILLLWFIERFNI